MKNIITIDPLIRIASNDVPSPIIIRVTKFDTENAEKVSDQISKAHNSGQGIIPLIIDSYGGNVHSLLSMISDIENSKIPVATIAVGKAMSCGAVLLACGASGHRYADPNAVIMIHDVSSWTCGKVEEMKADAKEIDRLEKMIYIMMAHKCGHKNKNYFLDLIHKKSHADWYLNPQEAKTHKIINHIRVPSFTTTISLEIALE